MSNEQSVPNTDRDYAKGRFDKDSVVVVRDDHADGEITVYDKRMVPVDIRRDKYSVLHHPDPHVRTVDTATDDGGQADE
jgi:hypothetical protein